MKGEPLKEGRRVLRQARLEHRGAPPYQLDESEVQIRTLSEMSLINHAILPQASDVRSRRSHHRNCGLRKAHKFDDARDVPLIVLL